MRDYAFIAINHAAQRKEPSSAAKERAKDARKDARRTRHEPDHQGSHYRHIPAEELRDYAAQI